MKFPESWLTDFVASPLAGEALAHALTMAGLESEELAAVAPPFNDVVVSRVVEVARHPDADRLNVCRVDCGDGQLRQIVCGAPNVAAGMLVPCALPGAKLPGGMEIRLAKVRGVESSGMLCSARELGLSDDAAGLLALDASLVPGTGLRAALGLDDLVHTLKMTPNRGDCLSLLGIARELAAITGAALRTPKIEPVAVTSAAQRAIVLDAPQGCPRYCGRVIKGVDARRPTPAWMKTRLERCGLRSISALVDITNYVMLELGQPLHAFDDAHLSGAIHARMAKPGERLLLLNEQTVAVDADVLMIADDEKPLAMAGIMGGEDSGISLATRDLFLESAFFAPAAIAGRARRYGFVSDASHRFERGVDFAGARNALERASQLVLEICGGAAGPVTEGSAALPLRSPVRLRLPRLARVLGVELAAVTVEALLTRLALAVTRDGDALIVTPPSYRFDIEIEEDLIEEVARLHGYEAIPVAPPCAALTMLAQSESSRSPASLRRRLVERGYQEVINFAFVDAEWESGLAGNTQPIRLANPIASQLSVMRSSLLGGLVGSLVANQRRKQTRVRLFEAGRCFLRATPGDPVAGFAQPRRLAMLAWGGAQPEQWGEPTRRVDFFDLKRDVEELLAGRAASFGATTHPALHPGRAASVSVDGVTIGCMGELHPRWVQAFELGTAPIVGELDLDPLLLANAPHFVALSNFPTVVRDLAVVVAQEIPVQRVVEVARKAAAAIVQDIELFDLYAGKAIGEGKKSIAFRIVMQDTQKTLQDAEVDAAMQQLLTALTVVLGAERRA